MFRRLIRGIENVQSQFLLPDNGYGINPPTLRVDALRPPHGGCLWPDQLPILNVGHENIAHRRIGKINRVAHEMKIAAGIEVAGSNCSVLAGVRRRRIDAKDVHPD